MITLFCCVKQSAIRSQPLVLCWDQFGHCQRGFSRSSEASKESPRLLL